MNSSHHINHNTTTRIGDVDVKLLRIMVVRFQVQDASQGEYTVKSIKMLERKSIIIKYSSKFKQSHHSMKDKLQKRQKNLMHDIYIYIYIYIAKLLEPMGKATTVNPK